MSDTDTTLSPAAEIEMLMGRLIAYDPQSGFSATVLEAKDRIHALLQNGERYRNQLKHLAALCGMASSRLCAPVSEKDIQTAKECVETGIYVMRQLVEEDRAKASQ